MLQANRFLAVILLTSACAAPVETLREDKAVELQSTQPEIQLNVEGELPSLAGATAWHNSQPLTAADLRGKVVLIHFWTYTCINWLRADPYIKAWAEKYGENGLMVIGVHSPEFEFEKEIENVKRAAADLNVDYPIAVDSGHKIWNAFGNQYWPALYFVDSQGRIRHHQFGEGDYERSERVIQALLFESGRRDVNTDLAAVNGQGVKAAADWDNLRSPENYLGYERTVNFGSPGGSVPNELATYALPAELTLNHWGLEGSWKIRQAAALSEKAGGRVAYRFHARDLNLVMGPGTAGAAVRFRVLIDGKPPGFSHGIDVDNEGYGTLSAPRMYQMVRQTGPVEDRHFEIEFFDPGAEVFAFTFG